MLMITFWHHYKRFLPLPGDMGKQQAEMFEEVR